MANEKRWRWILVVACIAIAFTCYTVDYIIFRDPETIFQFLLEETGFVFISVILVGLVIDKILSQREKSNRMQKLNMVIGTFFSQVGTDLIALVADFDANAKTISQELVVADNWTGEKFKKVQKLVKEHPSDIIIPEGNLYTLKSLLHSNQNFLLGLLQNPNLLEHESFTDLLWALFHLSEELVNRKNLDKLSNADQVHITGDISRAYKSLICEWLNYMNHLKNDYPYLFSFAIRTNPFDPSARVEFEDAATPATDTGSLVVSTPQC